MKLYHVYRKKWVDVSDYTNKAWLEGRRPFLFDREPNLDELKKAEDDRNDTLNNWVKIQKHRAEKEGTPIPNKISENVKYGEGDRYYSKDEIYALKQEYYKKGYKR